MTLRAGTPQVTRILFCTTLILGSRGVSTWSPDYVPPLCRSWQPPTVCAAVIKAPVLLKVVSLGDQLLLNWVTLGSATQEPQQLELMVDKYTSSKTGDATCIGAEVAASLRALQVCEGEQRTSFLQSFRHATRTWMSLSASCAVKLTLQRKLPTRSNQPPAIPRALLQLALGKNPRHLMVLLMMNFPKVGSASRSRQQLWVASLFT